MRFSVLLTLFLFLGCSTSSVFTDAEGKEWKAKLKGNGLSSVEEGEFKMTIESKGPIEFPAIPVDIEP